MSRPIVSDPYALTRHKADRSPDIVRGYAGAKLHLYGCYAASPVFQNHVLIGYSNRWIHSSASLRRYACRCSTLRILPGWQGLASGLTRSRCRLGRGGGSEAVLASSVSGCYFHHAGGTAMNPEQKAVSILAEHWDGRLPVDPARIANR